LTESFRSPENSAGLLPHSPPEPFDESVESAILSTSRSGSLGGSGFGRGLGLVSGGGESLAPGATEGPCGGSMVKVFSRGFRSCSSSRGLTVGESTWGGLAVGLYSTGGLSRDGWDDSDCSADSSRSARSDGVICGRFGRGSWREVGELSCGERGVDGGGKMDCGGFCPNGFITSSPLSVSR
jgi:hypothetical protein